MEIVKLEGDNIRLSQEINAISAVAKEQNPI
jgi:hypothetical protein